MNIKKIALIGFLYPALAWAEEPQSAIEVARLEMVEKMYKSGADHFRRALSEQGLTEIEVEDRLFGAIDEYAGCVVLAAQAQAREQGLPEDIVLKGVGGGTRGKEEAEILLALDMDALTEKRTICNKELGDALGITVQ